MPLVASAPQRSGTRGLQKPESQFEVSADLANGGLLASVPSLPMPIDRNRTRTPFTRFPRRGEMLMH